MDVAAAVAAELKLLDPTVRREQLPPIAADRRIHSPVN